MEIIAIQHLRALAALMVVVFHLHPQLERMGYTGHWPDGLSNGVDIFFVVSGFIMWVTTANRQMSPGGFYLRRIVRIVPLYWLLTSVMVTILLLAPNLVQTARFDADHTLASYLFLAWPSPAGHVEPVLIPGWTLNYEMFFYLLFGLALWLPQRLRLTAMALVLTALVASGNWIAPDASPATAFYTSSIMLEFLAGMILGKIYRAGASPVSAFMGWLLLGTGLLMIALPDYWIASQAPRAIKAGLPATIIVAAALAIEQRGATPTWQWFRQLGDASYSLYLTHPLVLSAVSQAWRKAGLPVTPSGWVAFSGLALTLCILVGMLSYRYIEMPITHLLSKRKRFATRQAVP